jgi:hypothetical protein
VHGRDRPLYTNIVYPFPINPPSYLRGFPLTATRHLLGFPQYGLVISLSAIAFSCGMSSAHFASWFSFTRKELGLLECVLDSRLFLNLEAVDSDFYLGVHGVQIGNRYVAVFILMCCQRLCDLLDVSTLNLDD